MHLAQLTHAFIAGPGMAAVKLGPKFWPTPSLRHCVAGVKALKGAARHRTGAL